MASEDTATESVEADAAKDQRRLDRIEVMIAILLGMAAILTAWATFQSSQLAGSVAAEYSEGIRAADAASQKYNDATAIEIANEGIFLEYTKALHSGEPELAAYMHSSLMTPELAAVIDWWEEQPTSSGIATPFTSENPNWSNPEIAAAKQQDAVAEEHFFEADRIDALGVAFDILAIIIAIGLFLFGVASLVRQERIKVGLGIVGAVILVFSIIRLVGLGNPAGVGVGFLW